MKRPVELLLAGMLMFIIIFTSCEKVVFPPVEINIPETVSYTTDIQPIWDANCVTCHGGQRNPDLRSGGSYDALISGGYVNTGDPPESKLIKKLYGSHDSRAKEAEKQLILGWIDQGAKNN